MLCNYPVEIIEEILLNLGIHDLISTIKMNRRLYSIAHSEKTPLRHRLENDLFGIEPSIFKYVENGEAFQRCECNVSLCKLCQFGSIFSNFNLFLFPCQNKT